MTSIIIYTTREKLEHKKDKSLVVAFWTLPNMPKDFDNDSEDRIYFAYEGFVQGYFEGDFPRMYSGKEIPEPSIKWYPASWTELKSKVPTKSFQGFKYAREEFT